MFMKYQEYNENKLLENKNINSKDFYKNNNLIIQKIIIFNFGMLFFGYLGEINILPKYISITIGFYFFAKLFSLIYYNYAINSKVGKQLFHFLFIFYSIAAVFPTIPKIFVIIY